MVVVDVAEGSHGGAMSRSDEGVEIGDAIFAKTNIGADERSFEVGKGARGRRELRESFPKVGEIQINKKRGVELHFGLVMGEIGSLKEALKLREVAADLGWVRWVENRCIPLSWDWHVKFRVGHGARCRKAIGDVCGVKMQKSAASGGKSEGAGSKR